MFNSLHIRSIPAHPLTLLRIRQFLDIQLGDDQPIEHDLQQFEQELGV